MTIQQPIESTPRERNRAFRATFEYANRDVKLVAVQPVAILAPPPQAAQPRANEHGSWIELRDDRGRTVYRRVIQNPIEDTLEVVTDEPQASLSRIPIEQPGGIFFVVLPDIPLARNLVLTVEPSRRVAGLEGATAMPAPDVFTFDLAASQGGE